jgi:beta-galactosidase
LLDSKGILCLDARNVVRFELAGDGKLIDDQGTSSGARKVEVYNGRAIIRVTLNRGKSFASVKSEGIPMAFCELN